MSETASDPLESPSSGRDSRPPPRWAVLAAGALIAAAAVAAYRNGLGAPLAFDDVPPITENPSIRHLGDLGAVLSPPPGGFTVSGRPMLNLSLAVNYALGGTGVRGYHALNLGIHILAGLALLGILRRTLAPRAAALWLALAASLIWTLHPLQTESVTYIIQRAESLMGLFYLLTLYCFIRYAEVGATENGLPGGSNGARRPGALVWGILSVGACLLGMATKEVMVSAPVIVLLYDRTFVAGSLRGALRRGWYYAGLAATWLPLGWLALHTGSRGRTAGMNLGMSASSYWLTQAHAIVHYLRLAFWPERLVLDYGFNPVGSAGAVGPEIAAVAALAAAAAWALFSPKARGFGPRALGFSGAFFLAILAPTCLVPVVVQIMAEHRMYLALAPVVAAAVIGAHALLRQALSRAGIPGSPLIVHVPLCLAVAVACGLRTARRNEDYRTELTLWGATVAERPDNPRAQYNYGLALANLGDNTGAMGRYREALRLKPDYPEAHNNLGATLANAENWPGAVAEYTEALRLDPSFGKAHYNLGNALLHFGRLGEAIAHYEEALRLGAESPEVDYNLGIALTRSGRPTDAVPVYERALRLKPDDVYVHNNLGAVLSGLGRIPEAIAHYKAALALRPDLAKTHNDLGTALARSGSVDAATAQFEEAVRLDPNFLEARLNLGHALMLGGRTLESRAQYEEASRLQAGPSQAHP
jgi:tetratricopeptide (TPR) repeat protein